jgi:hypothetical protein
MAAKAPEHPLSRRNTSNCFDADNPDFPDEAFERSSPKDITKGRFEMRFGGTTESRLSVSSE